MCKSEPNHPSPSRSYKEKLKPLAVVQYLVQQGADKEKAATNGWALLFVAAQKGHLEVVQFRSRASTSTRPDSPSRGCT